MINKRDVARLPHHVPMELCTTRAKYRQGKKLTAVKVYTVNNESQHLLVCGVPSLGLQDELRRVCARFGDIKSLVFVPRHAEEEFTDVFHVQYSRIQSARYAKRHLDNRSFYGGILHVCYAPEMESLAETRAKLVQRRREVAIRTRGTEVSPLPVPDQSSSQLKQYHRRKKHPALPLTEDRLAQAGPSEVACIWQGIPREIDPRTVMPAPAFVEPRVYGPSRPDDGWALAGVRERWTEPSRSHVRQGDGTVKKPSAPAARVLESTGTSSTSAILRFIPRQVSSKSRIVFRDKVANADPDKLSSLKRDSEHLDSSDTSLDVSIMEVRKKIRAVSVPNVQVLLEREDPLAAKKWVEGSVEHCEARL